MSSPTTAPAPGFADRLRAQAGGAATSSLVATALIQLLNVVTGVILARTLGPSGRGELAAVVLWPTMLWTVGNLGVVDSVTFHSARSTAPQRSIVSTSLAIALVQSAVLVAIGLVLVPLVLARQEASVVRDCLIFLASIPTSLVTLYLGLGPQRNASLRALQRRAGPPFSSATPPGWWRLQSPRSSR